MPARMEILEGLTALANQYQGLAMAWHLLIILVLVRKGWRPRQNHAAQLLLLPLLSVSVLAWIQGNPFNGLMFLIIAGILGFISFRLQRRSVTLSRKWTFPLGITAILYALVYPHFLVAESPWLYLIAAPVGIVPCPTLSLVLGFGLLFNGFHSRAWSGTVAAFGLFYALFGALVLGVWLDLGLMLFAISMGIMAMAKDELHFHAVGSN